MRSVGRIDVVCEVLRDAVTGQFGCKWRRGYNCLGGNGKWWQEGFGRRARKTKNKVGWDFRVGKFLLTRKCDFSCGRIVQRKLCPQSIDSALFVLGGRKATDGRRGTEN